MARYVQRKKKTKDCWLVWRGGAERRPGRGWWFVAVCLLFRRCIRAVFERTQSTQNGKLHNPHPIPLFLFFFFLFLRFPRRNNHRVLICTRWYREWRIRVRKIEELTTEQGLHVCISMYSLFHDARSEQRTGQRASKGRGRRRTAEDRGWQLGSYQLAAIGLYRIGSRYIQPFQTPLILPVCIVKPALHVIKTVSRVAVEQPAGPGMASIDAAMGLAVAAMQRVWFLLHTFSPGWITLAKTDVALLMSGAIEEGASSSPSSGLTLLYST